MLSNEDNPGAEISKAPDFSNKALLVVLVEAAMHRAAAERCSQAAVVRHCKTVTYYGHGVAMKWPQGPVALAYIYRDSVQ